MRTDEGMATGDELEVWRLLPWLANGSLEGDELARVLRHLRSSSACREELLFLSELRHAVEIASNEDLEPSAERLERLMERIEWHESERGTAAEVLPRSGREVAARNGNGVPRRWLTWGAAWATAAAVILLLVAIGGRVALPGLGDAIYAPVFRTLSAGEPSTRSAAEAHGSRDDRPLVRIVFEGDTRESEFRSLLVQLNLEIVSGPTPAGVYSLGSARTRDAGSLPSDLLGRLRSDGRVRFAEWIVDE